MHSNHHQCACTLPRSGYFLCCASRVEPCQANRVKPYQATHGRMHITTATAPEHRKNYALLHQVDNRPAACHLLTPRPTLAETNMQPANARNMHKQKRATAMDNARKQTLGRSAPNPRAPSTQHPSNAPGSSCKTLSFRMHRLEC
jgi:hypothetical protein